MLVKIILALAIACMFMGGIGAAGGITGLKTAIADKQIVSNSAMLDKAIINWYTSHDYELPESLSKDMLAIMGLHDIDLSKFTYTKLSDNKFRLVANLSGKKTETSVNSDRDLPLKPVSDVPSSNPAKAETTVDFGEDGAEYIVTLYHVLSGGENDGSPDIVSRSLKLSGKVTFLLEKDGPAYLYNKTTNEYILGYNGFSHSSYWVEFSKKS